MQSIRYLSNRLIAQSCIVSSLRFAASSSSANKTTTMAASPIIRIHARQIFDSRGNPTVEVDLSTAKGNNPCCVQWRCVFSDYVHSGFIQWRCSVVAVVQWLCSVAVALCSVALFSDCVFSGAVQWWLCVQWRCGSVVAVCSVALWFSGSLPFSLRLTVVFFVSSLSVSSFHRLSLHLQLLNLFLNVLL